MLALVCAAVALLLLDRPAPTPPDEAAKNAAQPASAEPPEPRSTDASAAGDPIEPAAPRGEAEAPRRPVVPSSQGQSPLLIGRCVDENGRPLADCELSFRALQPRDVRPPRPQRSGTDGRFAIPIDPYTVLELRVRAPQRATLVTATGSLDPGARLALGDVVLRDGRTVFGAVVDENGAPQRDLRVHLWREARGIFRADVRPLRSLEGYSDATGGVRFDDPVLSGRWRIGIAGQSLKSEAALEIPPGRGEFAFEARVASSAGNATISGRILDQHGEPVSDASVSARTATRSESTFTHSGGDGRFTLLRAKLPAEAPVRLRAIAAGCADLEHTADVAWGDSDVQLSMTRGTALTVRATDERGRAVEQFALHVFPRDVAAVADLRARSRGRHPRGVAHAHGVRPGPQIVVVRPDDPSLVQDGLLRLEGTGGVQRCDVQVGTRVHRTVSVLGADGARLAHAQLELLLALDDRPITAKTPAVELMNLSYHRDPALRHELAYSDPRGFAVLSGHPLSSYELRVSAADHVTAVESIVLGLVPDPWVIRLRPGARVVGRIEPSEVIAWLCEASQATAPRARPLRLHGPGATLSPLRLTLWREVGGVREELHATPTPDAPSAFVFANVPAGSWTLDLGWTWKVPAAARPPKESRTLAHVAQLTDGEVRSLALTVHDLPVGLLEGRVLRRGAPHRGMTLQPAGESNAAAGGWFVQGDREGRFRAALPAGAWRCIAQHLAENDRVLVPVDDIVTLHPGQRVAAVFHVRDGTLRLAVLDAARQPAAALTLRIARVDGEPHSVELRTDSEGRATTRLPAGRFAVAVTTGIAGADEKAIALGEVVVTEGDNAAEVLLHLPAKGKN